MALCVWWVGWAGGDSNSGSVALGRDWLVGGNVLKKGFLCVFGKKQLLRACVSCVLRNVSKIWHQTNKQNIKYGWSDVTIAKGSFDEQFR